MNPPSPTLPPPTYEDLSSLLEYSLVQPELSEDDVARRCALALQYRIAAVIVRPSDLDLAARSLAGVDVRLSTLVSGTDGYATTAVKTYETREMLRRGAQEIDTVMNTGKLISRQFQYLETELLQMADACHQSGAILKIELESEHLNEELNIVACRIARRAGADYIATRKAEDLAILNAHLRDRLRVKFAGAVSDLDAVLALKAGGCTRIALTDPKPILEEWKQRLAGDAKSGT